MKLTAAEAHADYITINLGKIYIPDGIKAKSYGLDGYLNEQLALIRRGLEETK